MAVIANPVKYSFAQDWDHYTLTSLGVEPAQGYPSCKGCKECRGHGQKLTSKEAFELEYVEWFVEHMEEKFHIKFSFLVDPSELADNHNQVVKIAEFEEKRLIQDGKIEEFLS